MTSSFFCCVSAIFLLIAVFYWIKNDVRASFVFLLFFLLLLVCFFALWQPNREADMKFSYMAGVVDADDRSRFERQLFRTTRGNCYVRFAEVEQPITDPVTGASVLKLVFIVFYKVWFYRVVLVYCVNQRRLCCTTVLEYYTVRVSADSEYANVGLGFVFPAMRGRLIPATAKQTYWLS